MAHGVDHREGGRQSTQRRVSYRRLRDDAALQDDDGVHMHHSRHQDYAKGTILSSRAALMSPRGPPSATTGVGNVHLGLQDHGGRDAAGDDDNDLMHLHASLSVPWPLWYEALLAARCAFSSQRLTCDWLCCRDWFGCHHNRTLHKPKALAK